MSVVRGSPNETGARSFARPHDEKNVLPQQQHTSSSRTSSVSIDDVLDDAVNDSFQAWDEGGDVGDVGDDEFGDDEVGDDEFGDDDFGNEFGDTFGDELGDTRAVAPTNPLVFGSILGGFGNRGNNRDAASVTVSGSKFDAVFPETLALVSEHLEVLVADDNLFRSVDFEVMSLGLKNLTRLTIAANVIGDAFRFVVNSSRVKGPLTLDPFRALTVLYASANRIGLNGLLELGKLQALRRLDLSRNKVSNLTRLHKKQHRDGGDSFENLFPSLTHLDLSGQHPKLVTNGWSLVCTLGALPKLRVLLLRNNAFEGWVGGGGGDRNDEIKNEPDTCLVPGEHFPNLRAVDLRDNVIVNITDIAPLARLATRGTRRDRRGISAFGIESGGPDDCDEDEEDQNITSHASTSYRSLSDTFSFSGSLEEVAVSGNPCAVSTLRAMERFVESVRAISHGSDSAGSRCVDFQSVLAFANDELVDDRGLSSNTSGSAGHTKQRLTRLTPGQRTEKAIARGLLFRNVTPRLRFGTENALGTALGFLLSDDDCLTTASVQGKSPHHGSGAVIILRDSSRDTAFGQLAADGETQQKTSHMNMTKMATATDPLPRPEKGTAITFDFDKPVTNETIGVSKKKSSAGEVCAANLDAWRAADQRKAFNRQYTQARCASIV